MFNFIPADRKVQEGSRQDIQGNILRKWETQTLFLTLGSPALDF